MNLPSATAKTTRLEQLTLDQVWREAETLGVVEIDHAIGDSSYRAEIMFTRKSGTRIIAIGFDQDVLFALGKAINEARELGAGDS
jgi:hypothetical protein